VRGGIIEFLHKALSTFLKRTIVLLPREIALDFV